MPRPPREPLTIPLTNGGCTIVSVEDFEALSQFKWHARKYKTRNKSYSYAIRAMGYGKSQKIVRMHRAILDAGKTDLVDHINGDTLDNRRENLRIATKVQNAANQAGRRSKSGFKGVVQTPYGWKAVVCCNYKHHRMGPFTTAEQAARAYDAKAKELFGDFARPNFN